MAGRNYHAGTVSVDVIAKLKDSKNSLSSAVDRFKEQLSNIDVGSSFGKNAEKALGFIENKLNELESIDLSSKLFNTKDLSRFQKISTQIANKMSVLGIQGSKTSVKDWNFFRDEDLDKLKELQKKYDEAAASMINFRKSISTAFFKTDQLEDLQKLQKLAKEGINFKENSSSIKNKESLLKQKASFEQRSKSLEEDIKKYKELKQVVDDAEASLKRAKETDFEKLKNVKGLGSKGRTKQDIVSEYQELLKEQLKDGTFKEGGETFTKAVAEMLSIPKEDLEKTADKIVDQLNAALENKIISEKGNFLGEFRKKVKDYFSEETGINTEELENSLFSAKEALANHILDSDIKVKKGQDPLKAFQDSADQTKEKIKKVEEALRIIEEFKGGESSEYFQELGADVEKAREELTQFRNQLVQSASAPLNDIANEIRGEAGKINLAALKNSEENYLKAEAEAQQRQLELDSETFRNNLKESLTRWISVQTIVTAVKDGIRHAWQDIQNLDKAMTNIAVVTDMSVGDLWGKIDEYMSIAQQYGVTTQGVYEVSQLYYQQGLGTADVMAATTETLKLARVAGMGYADAADAMTVAIRSFKMEMSDAQTVTDVYSKVAA